MPKPSGRARLSSRAVYVTEPSLPIQSQILIMSICAGGAQRCAGGQLVNSETDALATPARVSRVKAMTPARSAAFAAAGHMRILLCSISCPACAARLQEEPCQMLIKLPCQGRCSGSAAPCRSYLAGMERALLCGVSVSIVAHIGSNRPQRSKKAG